MVHAFRIKSLSDFGILSWTHVWANGISLWKAYQFIPHYLTLGIVQLFHVPIPRAMVIITIILFVLLRFFIYFSLRLLKFTPLTAFVCAILSFDIGQYWEGVGDFSLLFGFTFFPLVIYLWAQFFKGKIQYVFPYIVGLLFYIHPLLGVSAMSLWATAILFSDKQIISLATCIQLGIILSTSSLFWFPIVFKTGYVYSSSVLANREFLSLVLAHYDYFGLSLFLGICFLLSLIRIFMPISPRYSWTKILFLFVAGYLLLVFLGVTVTLPKFIDQFQFTRGIAMVGIGILFAFAPVVERLRIIKSAAVKGFLLFFLCLAFMEGIWFTSIYSPTPAKALDEAVVAFANTNSNLLQSRIWTPTIDTSSYNAYANIRYPYSYMQHLESNQISPRLSSLIIYQPYLNEVPPPNVERINDYFKISGTQYAVFEENSPLAKTFADADVSTYKNLGKIKSADSYYILFEIPWKAKNAALIDKKYKNQLDNFSFNLQLTQANDQITLDDYVKKFSGIIYKDENLALDISYPTPDSLQVTIPANRRTSIVYIDESYDKEWRAYFHNRLQPIQSSGPNYMLVTLDNLQNGGTLTLKHSWPLSFYISLFFIFLIPLEITVIAILRKILIKKQEFGRLS